MLFAESSMWKERVGRDAEGSPLASRSPLDAQESISNMRPSFEFLVLIMTVAACDRAHAQPEQHAAPAATNESASNGVKAPGEARIGDTTTCTLHREHRIVVTAATPKVEYQGKTYYFCCPVCANKFGERPSAYIK